MHVNVRIKFCQLALGVFQILKKDLRNIEIVSIEFILELSSYKTILKIGDWICMILSEIKIN